jgi:tripartite-type tricarboxylate transporter receptor subunit TctC
LQRLLAAVVLATVPATAFAQGDFPQRPVRIVVPFAAGGGGDHIVRAWSDRLAEVLKQPVIVDNKGGANTILGTDVVANAKPDGYTLLLVNPNFATNPALNPRLPYVAEEFSPVTLVAFYAMGLAAPSSFPPKTIAELVDYARRKPGEVNFGTSGTGSTSHLAGELLKASAGIQITHVPYRGAGPAMNDLIGGHIELVFTGMSQILPHVRSGTVKLLGSSGLERLKSSPDVVPIAEQGVPGFEALVWWGVVAPPKTPPEIVAKLNAALVQVLAEPAVVERLAANDTEAKTMKPEEFGRFIHDETVKWGGLIAKAGIKAE